MFEPLMRPFKWGTLEYELSVPSGINVPPGKFIKINKHAPLENWILQLKHLVKREEFCYNMVKKGKFLQNITVIFIKTCNNGTK